MEAVKYLTEIYPIRSSMFIITNSSTLDGGRNSFYCESKEINFWIRIVDKAIESDQYENGYCPGGLYLNEFLVDINSELEKLILDILENANLSEDYDIEFNEEDQKRFGVSNMIELEKLRIKEKIDFIKSDQYLKLGRVTKRI